MSKGQEPKRALLGKKPRKTVKRSATTKARQTDPARGKRIIAARKAIHMEQKELAGIVGYDPGSIRRIERGGYLKPAVKAVIARALNVSEAYIDGTEAIAIPPTNAKKMSASQDHQRPAPLAWPQWAREAWGELQLQFIREGADDATLDVLKGFVLADELLEQHNGDDAALRLCVQAGAAAARTWMTIYKARGTR